MVSAPSYLLHSQKQVYELIGKCQTQSRLVKHKLTFPTRATHARELAARKRTRVRRRKQLRREKRNDGGKSDRTSR